MIKCKRAGLPENTSGFCLDICKFYKPTQDRLEPAKPNKGGSFKYAVPNTKRYLKLHNGDIYDVDSNTVLNRLVLLTMLT